MCLNYYFDFNLFEYLIFETDCDFNLKDSKNNKSALHYLIDQPKTFEIINLILENKEIEFQYLNEKKESYLHIISKIKSNYSSIPTFIEKKSDLNLKDVNGNTPLHSIFFQEPDFKLYGGENLKILYKKIFFSSVLYDANFDIKNNSNLSCRDIIIQNNQISN